ncbi:MAG: hypothetical protein HDS15_05135 [Bacteroides sp.]|nr:hypothetical protein [Bacteroides sp.]
MKKRKKYIPSDHYRLSIKTLKDIARLKNLISLYGSFSSKDYNYFIEQIKRDKVALEIIREYKKQIKNLVTGDATNIKSKQDNTPVYKSVIAPPAKKNIFEELHPVSDFKFKTGALYLGLWKLEDERIRAVSSNVLSKIEYKFQIKPYSFTQRIFQFFPTSDLSYLLDLIEKVENTPRIKQFFEDYRNILRDKIRIYISQYSSPLIKTANNFQWIMKYFYRMISYYNLSVLSEEIFINRLYECNLCVPIENLEIFDGYLNISMKDVRFKNPPSWEACKRFLTIRRYFDNTDLHFLRLFEEEIIEIFQESISELHSLLNSRNSIRVNTYMTRNGFQEDVLDGNVKKKCFEFPLVYLYNAENSGFSILFNNWDIIERCLHLSSEAFCFTPQIDKSIARRIGKIKNINIDQEILNILRKPLSYKVRYVPKYYRNRINLNKLSYIRDINTTTILLFTEDRSHYSDNWCGHNAHTSYMTIDPSSKEIIIYPCLEDLAIYKFSINDSVISINEAACILIKYFSSTTCNKRQYFNINIQAVLQACGISNRQRLPRP